MPDKDLTIPDGLDTLAQPADERSAPFRFSLLIYHRDGSQIVPLRSGSSVVVGRARPADIAIREHSLSRQHARFELVDDALWVHDLGSTNGTRVNGKKIERAQVKPGEQVAMGSVFVTLHAFSEETSEPDGLESHDRFVTRLEQQLASARTFGRPLAVLMVQAGKRKDGHISLWGPRLRRRLRAADAIALYGPCEVLICLAEVGQKEAVALAEKVIGARLRTEPELLFGIAAYPRDGGSAEELIEAARSATRRATRRHPVQLSDDAEQPARATESNDPVPANPKTVRVYETAQRVAEAEIPVLINGETGTGKEVLARAIHHWSGRRDKPLRCLNCGAIPANLVESALFGHERGAFTGADRQAKGLFEEANGGTVLLDEIGELSPAAQTALLRVIETKRINRVGSASDFEVDVRIIAATHRDLEAMCEAGRFRWDLFYRLNTMMLELPPLRERAEDIISLAEHFMRSAAKANRCVLKAIDPAAQQLLRTYRWPGNVRELRNAIERAAVIAEDETIAVDDLPERVRRGQPELAATAPPPPPEDGQFDLKEQLRQYEGQLLLEALKANDWNQTQTAKALNMPLRTLVHKIRQHGLKKRYES